ncbi:winged helix-turn-helix transcriptional regulator [soil metagenome]
MFHKLSTWTSGCKVPGVNGTPERRTYNQYCGIARALDVLGERWTLLVVRDLLPGPRRYKELVAGLPGIGTDLLTARLRTLEEHGLVDRTHIGGTGGGVVYRLTTAGEELRPVVEALATVGLQWLEPPERTGRDLNLAWALATIRMSLPPDIVPSEPLALHGGLEGFVLSRGDGEINVTYSADFVGHTLLRGTDLELLAVLTGRVALDDSTVEVVGDRQLVRRWLEAIRSSLSEPLSG